MNPNILLDKITCISPGLAHRGRTFPSGDTERAPRVSTKAVESATMASMGYDFTLLDLPSDLAKMRDIANREPEREAFQRYLRAVEPYSLHLNIAATGYCREQMARFGMLAGGDSEPFPLYPTWDRSMYGSEIEHRLANPDLWCAYEDAERRASSQRGEGPGIARFKLQSNGPWIVVAEEIRTALSAYDRVSPAARSDAEADPVWADWIGWLRRATSGFEVS